jgi:hypothetical protein
MLKSGSYKKLLNAYYSSQDAQSETEVKKTITDLTSAKSDASSASSAAKKLAETDFSSDNMDEIVKNVQSFVDSYNELLDSASEVDDRATLRQTLWMTQITEKNSGLLSSIGITIGENNKLELNTDTLKKAADSETKSAELADAKMSTLKSLFSSQRGSYLSDITTKMENITSSASTALTKASSTNSYSSSGTYSTVSGLLYDTES